MNKALLDTDIYSEILKAIDQTVTRNATTYRQAQGRLSFSVITVMEIIQGLQKVGASPKRIQAFRTAIVPEEILPLDQDAADLAGLIAGDLDRVGRPIGRCDPMIAAVAIRNGLELVTGNTSHYQSRGLSQEGGFPGGSLWTIPLEMCSIVGELTPISIDGGSPMSTITQRIASAFVVLCGRYGDVTKMAHDREQSRQSLYREASQVANAVDGTAVQSRIDELQRQLAGQQAQIQDLQERLEHAIEITRDKQDEFASVAQAEGVSLSVARRLLQVVAGSVTTPSVPTLGRATEEAGQRAGQLLEVIDEVAQPKVKQATADEIFLGPNRS